MDAATEVKPGGGHSLRLSGTRFTPGTMVADRYRIVALLGEGGMGVVYRADDMKLGQRVALKCIPPELGDDADTIQRFYAEARIGRQIAHPNLCRVYDIIEASGHRFIAMEYVDGEDLSSLLRRIGRLPPDTALRLTRDLCSGLAAAHDRGIIHRDLKPANVLIDGIGTARVSDFGLSVLAADAPMEVAGTLAYMSPEQLAGAPATARGDLYALGLVLYEMYTGRPVFESDSFAGTRAQHLRPKTAPSAIVRDIDPVIERLIMRCIEEDPRARPASAHEILAALPGGDDPLDAAVAAGETPSPEMVVAASRVGDLGPRQAWTLLALLVALLVAILFAGERALLTWFAPEVKSREALVDRARTIIHAFGYDERAADWNAIFRPDSALLRGALAREGAAVLPAAGSWTRRFLYRDSPETLIAQNARGRIDENDPPFIVPGMTEVKVDGEGRLREFRRLASSLAADAPTTVDWTVAFREASLDPARFHVVPPVAVPPVGADRRYAWEGIDGSRSLHIEAASAGGRPVWFFVQPPWPRTSGGGIIPRDTGLVITLIYLSALIAGAFLGRRNVLRGRADLRGARRLAGFATVVQFAALVWRADHTFVLTAEWQLLTVLAGSSLYFGLLVWLCHLAIEPYVRRRWPHMLVSVKRLMAGRVRDPLVGADILRGLIAGCAGVAAWCAAEAWLMRRGLYVPLDQVLGPVTRSFGMALLFLDSVSRAIVATFVTLIVLVVARMIVRRDSAAFVITWIVMAMGADDLGGTFLVDCMIRGILVAPLLFVARRHGVLAFLTSAVTMFLLVYTPLTSDLTRWYGQYSAGVLLAIAAVGVYGFHTALAGKPLFGNVLVEDEAVA